MRLLLLGIADVSRPHKPPANSRLNLSQSLLPCHPGLQSSEQ